MMGGRLCDCDMVTGLVHSGPRRMTDLAEVTWRRRIILGVSQATDCFKSARYPTRSYKAAILTL